MLYIESLGVVKDSKDIVIGYRLKDENNKVMTIQCKDIIDALRKNLVQISNLQLNIEGKLEEIDTKLSESTVSNEQSDIEKMQQLIKKIDAANKVYEQEKDELIPNITYDKLYDKLLEMEERSGIVLPNSPTSKVGYEVVSELPKEKHSEIMLSLDKTKDKQAFKQLLQDKDGVLSWKLDGLTVVLTYNEGKLIKAVTRGNGEVGELVTANAKQFKNVPRQIAFKGKIVLRGEAVIKYSSFEVINSHILNAEDKYKNPRNLCSGSVRQLDSSITAKREVNWYCFSVVEVDKCNIGKLFSEQLSFVKLLGFEVVEHSIVNKNNIDSVMSTFEKKVTEKSYDIPSDGLVLTFNDIAYGKSLGNTSKFPRHSLAFKWKDEVVQTSLEYIEWSPSRTGLINPVAVFKPVDIEGSTVSRASVHNVSIFSDLEMGYGDTIEVYKANMIIPQVLDNLTRSNTCEIPCTCPECGCETEIHEDPSSSVWTLWCVNPECSAKGNRLLQHFVSRDAMNIDGISTATLITLVEAGIITDLASIFHIHEHSFEITRMEGFGDKSFNNMVYAIDQARKVKLANLIYALGIPNIGLATAKLICKHFNNDLKQTVCAKYNQLIQIDGIGEVIAQSFCNYFNTETHAKEFMDLIKEVNIIKEDIVTNTEMQGVTICVTGDVFIFKNRNQVKDTVERLGGKVTGSVSRSTSYLVTNDTTSGSSKNKKAQEYNITILTEKQFIEMFNIELGE